MTFIEEDKVWEQVLAVLSENGRLSRFYKIPRHEMRAYMRIGGQYAGSNLAYVFNLVQKNEVTLARQFINGLEVKHIYPMLLTVVRTIKCWVETDPERYNIVGKGARWKIANA